MRFFLTLSFHRSFIVLKLMIVSSFLLVYFFFFFFFFLVLQSLSGSFFFDLKERKSFFDCCSRFLNVSMEIS